MLLVKYLHRKITLLIISFLLALSSTMIGNMQVDAATTNSKAFGPISIGKNSTVQLKNADLFMQEKGLYLIYTLTYTNNGSSTLQLDDFWSKIKSTSGKSFTTNVLEKDKKISKLNAKSSVDITFYAPVDENTTLSKLLISIVKWDFSAPDYTRGIGTFYLSKWSNPITQAFKPKYTTTKESKLKTAVKGVKSSIEQEQRVLKISFLFENLNTREYRTANTQFYVLAADGSIYTAKNEALKELIVQPKERKIIDLQVTLPVKVNEKTLRLIAGNSYETEGIFAPIAVYQVPKSSTQTTTTEAISKTIYGDYQIEIIGYNRLPTGSQDTLTAIFKVSNISKTGQKVPQLKSTWLLNGISQEVVANLFPYDQRVQLAAGDSMQMLASMQVPYSANLKDIRVALKETIDQQTEKTVGQFISTRVNQFSNIADKKVEFDRLAANTSIELLKVRSSVDGRQFNVSGDLAISNLEPRSGELQKYGIYLRAEDGEIYPLTIAEYTKPIISNGRILVPFSGKVPLTAETDNMNILIAELIPLATEGNNTPAATVPGKVVSLATQWPNTNPKNKFNNIAIGNYDLSMDKFYAYLDYNSGSVSGVNLELEYSMLADSSFDDVAGPYKLRIEVEDQNTTKTTLSKEFTLDGGTEQEFKEGQAIKKTILFTDSNLSDRVDMFKDYKLSVYCVVNDQKVLLAQRTMPFFYIQWLEMLK